MSMAKYIENACRILKIKVESWVPINQPIDTDSPLLSAKGKAEFLTAVGMLGWLAQTMRFDVSYTYSRIAQHSVSPMESAMKAVRTAFAYLQKSKHYCISAQIHADDVDIMATLDKCSQEPEEWSFMVDSDHTGNAEVQNKRRSQNGLIIKLNKAPVMTLCSSKVSSVAFATPRIGEAHADMSSAAVELFSVVNATLDVMGLSYVVEEMGMTFPFTLEILMDNDAARTFCLGSAHKTKLKHIDCCQEWVRMLRDREIYDPCTCEGPATNSGHRNPPRHIPERKINFSI